MTKLKTLKDLPQTKMMGPLFSERNFTQEENFERIVKRTRRVLSNDLRAEAIKWVKDFRQRLNKVSWIDEMEAADEIMANFFNLTDEDLK